MRKPGRALSKVFVLLCVASCTELESARDEFGTSGRSGAGGAAGSSAGASFGGIGANGGSAGVNGGSAGVNGGSASRGGADCAPKTEAGGGCSRCAGTDLVSLENACTTSGCTPFDNSARLTLVGADGRLPSL
ncbi:MAG TPA: hypothetical protein VFQ61_14760, partial [Polyangiaceae bacterium]|nr:hypothetical protein [Polyangiaceae bacterium]